MKNTIIIIVIMAILLYIINSLYPEVYQSLGPVFFAPVYFFIIFRLIVFLKHLSKK